MSTRSMGFWVLWGAAALFLPAQDGARAVRVVPSAQAREVRVALVIGNARYGDGPLANPVNDARAMKEALESCRFEVTLLTDASKRAMEEAIRTFGTRIQNGAVGLFYFAGHGLQVEGANWLIPIGARLDKETDVPYEGVDVGRILDSMKAAGNKLNILILDACRNNPFALAKGWRSLGGKGLAQVKAPTGTLVAYATDPGSTAADGGGAHGLYTGALLEELQEPGVKVEDVFKRVRVRVSAATHDQQVPWEMGSLMGDFYFHPQRTPEELAREQETVQAETRRLEAELKAKLAQAQSAETAKEEERLQTRLRIQELERTRLEAEEARQREVATEHRRAEADQARRQEESARLEALKLKLAAGPEGASGDGAGMTLEDARQELARLNRQREALLQPIETEKAAALLKVDTDYSGLRLRLEAPRDEFETSAQYRERGRQAGELQVKREREQASLEAQFLQLAQAQTKALDGRIGALKARRFPMTLPVELEAYDPDRGRYQVRILLAPGRELTASLVLEPDRARELKGRKQWLKAAGAATLEGEGGLPDHLLDPVWGVLALDHIKASAALPPPAAGSGQSARTAPAWIDQEDVADGLAATGTARPNPMGDRGLQRATAIADARTKLAGKVKVRIKAVFGNLNRLLGAGAIREATLERLIQKVTRQMVDQELSGATTRSLWNDPQDDSLYVFVVLPTAVLDRALASIAKAQISQEVAQGEARLAPALEHLNAALATR